MKPNTNQSKSPLLNKTILVTRPSGRELDLCHLIKQAGGKVIHYPVIKIIPPNSHDILQLKKLNEQLHGFTMAIFISPTAVEQSQLYFPTLPSHLTIVSIGPATSRALKYLNLSVTSEALTHNSESLLQSKKFDSTNIQGQRILIFRGIGGRALLGETLMERGAHVRYVETYQRTLPSIPSLDEQQIAALDAITVSSSESLKNLLSMVDNTDTIFNIPITVPAQQTYSLAEKYTFKSIINAKNATDSATIQALNSHFST